MLFPVIAFIVSVFLCWLFMRTDSRFHILDYPNERSMHSKPVPRSGGVSILAGIYLSITGWAIWVGEVPSVVFWIVGAGLFVAIVSFLDDRFSLSIGYRIVVHFISASLLVYGGLGLEAIPFPGGALIPGKVLGILITLLVVIWMLNLYNFMDGMDGFAGGMALFGFGTYAILGWLAGNEVFMLLSLIIAAAASGFLVLNFPPARIFMGDTGSSLLGFFAVSFILWADHEGIFPIWIGILVFSPFVIDATATLFRRALKGENIWKAHKSHYYQRLVQAGWGHRRTVFLQYGIMFACGLMSILIVDASIFIQMVSLAIWTLFYIGFFLWITRIETKYSSC